MTQPQFFDFLVVLPGVWACQVPQRKLSSGSESTPDRLLPDLVHQGVGRLGRHLVAAVWCQGPNLGLVWYLGEKIVQFFFEQRNVTVFYISILLR